MQSTFSWKRKHWTKKINKIRNSHIPRIRLHPLLVGSMRLDGWLSFERQRWRRCSIMTECACAFPQNHHVHHTRWLYDSSLRASLSRPSNYFPRIEIVSVFTWALRSTPQFRLQLIHAHLNVSIMCIISRPGHKSLSGELQSDFLHICWPNGRDEWRLWRIHNIPRGNRTNRKKTEHKRVGKGHVFKLCVHMRML